MGAAQTRAIAPADAAGAHPNGELLRAARRLCTNTALRQPPAGIRSLARGSAPATDARVRAQWPAQRRPGAVRNLPPHLAERSACRAGSRDHGALRAYPRWRVENREPRTEN